MTAKYLRPTLSFLLLMLALTSLWSQKIGAWDTHFSYEGSIISICDAGDRVYALAYNKETESIGDTKLFTYYPEDSSTEIIVKFNSGNDDITHMVYSKSTEKLLLMRNDASIDIYDKSGNFFTISDLKNVTANIDKEINNISIDGDLAYISANFGLMIINMSRNEVKETCIFNNKFYTTCVNNNILYAATAQGVKTVDLSKNIQEASNWQTITLSDKNPYSDFQFSDSDIRYMTFFQGKLHFLILYNGLYYLTDDNKLERFLSNEYPIKMIPVDNDRLIVYSYDKVYNFTGLGDYYRLQADMAPTNAVEPKNNTSNQYWVGFGNKHLSLINVEDEASSKFSYTLSDIRPNGPLSNFAFNMRHDGDKLMCVGGGYWENKYWISAKLSIYKNLNWSNLDISSLNEKIKDVIPNGAQDFTMPISDPRDPSRIFVSSWGEGLYEFKNLDFVKLHRNFTPIVGEGTTDFYERLSGLAYDRNNNLWIANTTYKDLITVYTADGQWLKPDYSSLSTINFGEDGSAARRLIIDKNNRKWFISQRYCQLFIFDDNKTIANPQDDKVILQKSFFDQDLSNLAISVMNDLVEDKNGDMWLGTNIGPFVIYNSTNLFNKDKVTFNKVKIPRNDGTNNADILLENVIITAIAVDGANRKWIGTESAGLYLVSSNGLETIHAFNMSNSPLPSNNILSLEIDPSTGVVYIGTSKGIVTYRSDATEGKQDFSEVYAYPNPVRPEFEGTIAVYGLMQNTTVKITDVKGNIINTGTSLGGQYVWDGKNRNGEKVATGTYLVFGSSEDGTTGVVTKILVVK